MLLTLGQPGRPVARTEAKAVLVLKAQLEIGPESRSRFLRQIADLIEASRGEAGCLGFSCSEDVSAPNTFLVLQEWSDHAALAAHERSAHVAVFKAGVAGIVVARWPTRIYDVERVADLGS